MLDFQIGNRVDDNHPQKYKNTGKKSQKEVKKRTQPPIPAVAF